MKKEIWIQMINYNHNYFISNHGNIKNSSGLILKQRYDKFGYKRISLYIINNDTVKLKTFFIHRLVAEHFIKNPNNYPHVNFKDKYKDNVYVENLEWCKKACNPTRCSKNKGRAVINLDTNIEYTNIAEASKLSGLSRGSIYNCCNNRTKSAGGQKWIYK